MIMNTRFLMVASAITMGIIGLACSFFPAEIVGLLGFENNDYFFVFFQLFGAMYLGFAILNWMAKGNLIGGIYSKPVAIGNFMHFLVGSLTLFNFFMKHQDIKLILIPTLMYAILAFGFGKVAFGNPVFKKST